jgi:hypothetical protein
MDRITKIVAGGRKRAYEGSVARVRAEVEAKYAEELKTAGVWRRMRIRRNMQREMRERMERVAPRSGLY